MSEHKTTIKYLAGALIMNLEFTRMALVSSMLAALLICPGEIKISQAASSEQKVHTPVVEEIGELTDEELLKYEKEMSKPKNESGFQ